MASGARPGRIAATLTLAASLSFGFAASGCRTGTDDIERWSTTVNGPRKLVAVLIHEKYPLELRVEAAMALVRMKPRNGRRVGIELLVDALAELPPADRGKIIAKVVPVLEAEMRKPPPKAQASQTVLADPSVPFKDAAYALLSHEDGTLVADDVLKQKIRAALSEWAATDFSERMDDSSQMFGMEQMLRTLGAQGVRGLPTLIVPAGRKLDRIADLVADLGDEATKLDASKRLVEVAKDVDSDHWIQTKKPQLEQANKASGIKDVKPEAFKAQLYSFQEEELLRAFAMMKKVGGAPIIDYLLAYGANGGSLAKNTDKELVATAEKRRAAALAALEGKLDKNNAQQVAAVLAIASAADTPDPVRDQALRRVGEMPRKLVVDKLYTLFASENWKIRWVAASLILKMSDTSQLEEFLQKLAKVEGMAIAEPLQYGQLIAELKGDAKAADIVDKFAGKGPVPSRLTALAYYYTVGTAAQLGKVTPYERDGDKAPTCKEGAKDCEWKCTVTTGGKPEVKDVTTIGEFVGYCVKPAMEKRAAGGSDKK